MVEAAAVALAALSDDPMPATSATATASRSGAAITYEMAALQSGRLLTVGGYEFGHCYHEAEAHFFVSTTFTHPLNGQAWLGQGQGTPFGAIRAGCPAFYY